MRVLVIEDDTDISAAIVAMLTRHRYAVDVDDDGQSGLERLLTGTYDVAIVDVGLPSRDGFSICRSAREENIGTPLLILTALDAVEERIRGLDAGADDYLIKPFSADELSARVRALLRRADRPPQPQSYTVGSLEVDPNRRVASVAGTALQLGVTEFRLLEFFARHRGMTLSRAQILEKIWDYDFQGSSNIVDVYVSQLRQDERARRNRVDCDGVGRRLQARREDAKR